MISFQYQLLALLAVLLSVSSVVFLLKLLGIVCHRLSVAVGVDDLAV